MIAVTVSGGITRNISITDPESGVTRTVEVGLPGTRGAKGDPGDVGPEGPASTVPGPAGDPGESAYDVAVAAGFVGTQAQWIASLVGPKGANGTPGGPGPANSLSVGTITTGAAGSSATAAITGTAPAQVLNLSIPQGLAGINGTNGTNGTDGTNGAAGSKWYHGAGAPAGATGVVGDYYLNDTTSDVYNKTGASTWTLTANIKGAAGTNGTNGQGVPTGGTAGQVLSKVDGTNYNTQWATPSGGGSTSAGENYWRYEPYHMRGVASAFETKVGTWGYTNSNSNSTFGFMYNTSNAQNDSVAIPIWLGPGTYKLLCSGNFDTNRAIQTWELDDGAGNYTTLGTMDWYGAAAFDSMFSFTFTVGGTGPVYRKLRARSATRNAASVGWYQSMDIIVVQRTG